MKRLAALAAFKLSLFLKPRVSDEFFKRYSRLISPDVTEEEVAAYPTDAQTLFFDKPVLAARFARLQKLCGNDPIALTAVELYLLALMEERTVELLVSFYTDADLREQTEQKVYTLSFYDDGYRYLSAVPAVEG